MRIIYSLTFIQKFFKVSLNFASAWCSFWIFVTVVLLTTVCCCVEMLQNGTKFSITNSWLMPVLHWQDSKTFSLREVIPDWRVLGVLVSSAVITHFSEVWVMDAENFISTAVQHVAVGVACLGIFIATVYKYEKPFLQELANFRNTQTYVDKKVDWFVCEHYHCKTWLGSNLKGLLTAPTLFIHWWVLLSRNGLVIDMDIMRWFLAPMRAGTCKQLVTIINLCTIANWHQIFSIL